MTTELDAPAMSQAEAERIRPMTLEEAEDITQRIQAGFELLSLASALDRTPRRPRALAGYVYFIESGFGGPIKIGSAVDPQARLRELQTANPEELTLLARLSAGDRLAAEFALHRRFAHLHLRGEWFTPAADLLSYIGGIE